MITVNIREEEYKKLKDIQSKFHKLIQSDKYIHLEYVCGAGWGCTDFDNYFLLSKDEVTKQLALKLKTLIHSYNSMGIIDRIRHRPLDGDPYKRKQHENN